MLNAEQFKFHLARYAKVSEADAAAFVDAVSQVLIDRVKAGEEVEIQGLGTFSVIETQQGRRLALQVDERMRAAVNAPFACFEPMVVANAPRPVGEPVVADEPSEPIEPVAADGSETPAEPEPAAPEEPAAADGPSTAQVETVADALVENSAVALGNIVAAVGATKVAASAAEEEPVAAPEPATPSAKNEEKKEPEKPSADTPRPRRTRVEEKSLMDILQEKLPAVKPWMWGAIGGAIVLIILIIVLANACSGSEKKAAPEPAPTSEVVADTTSAGTVSEEPSAVKGEEPVPSAAKSPVKQPETKREATPSAKKQSASRPSDEQLWMEDGKPKRATLGNGGRLTLLALKNYGDKAFWAYIYDVNAFQLGDPNNVPIGKPLYLPDPTYYRIDAKDPASIKRAQNRAMQILNAWK